MYGAVSPSLGGVVDLGKTWAQIDSLLEDKLIGSKLDWRMLADSIAIKLKETETHEINEVANDHEKEKEDRSQVENLENSTKFVRLAAPDEKDVGEDENLTEMQSLLDAAVGAEYGDAKTSLGFVVSDRIGFSYVQVPPVVPAGEHSKNAQKIRGVVAREKLLPGTMILVEKPYLGVLDVEVARRYGDHWQDLDEAMDTDALACQMVTADPDFAANFDGSSAADEGGGGGGGMNSAEGRESEDSSENSDSDAAGRFGPDAWVQLLHPKGKEDLAARAGDEGGEEFDYSSDEDVDAAAKEADLKRYLLTDAEMSGAQEEDVDMDKVDKKASKLQDGGSDLDSEDSRSDAEELRQLQKQVHAEIRDILSPKFPSKADRDVLRAKTRYNSLGFYTANEQFCNPLIYKKFMGTGLYLLASHFNHSCAPNVARFSIGDITVFVVIADKPVEKGEELCISYIPTEECGESKNLRDENLSRDFVCACAKCVAEVAEKRAGGVAVKPETGDHEWAFVDEQLTAQLQLLPPLDALDNIDGMLESAKLLNHHKQELRGLKAIKLMHLGKWGRAQAVVSECIEWQVQAAGRFDESVVVYHLLAGICALAGELVATEEVVGADFPSAATTEAATETASKKRKKQAGAVMKQVGGGGGKLRSFQEHIAAARETFGVCTGFAGEGEDLGKWLWEKNKLEVEEYATWLAFAIEKNRRETIVAKMKSAMIGW
eukprot:g13464.t1